jgi:hypothetical protein
MSDVKMNIEIRYLGLINIENKIGLRPNPDEKRLEN